MINRMKIIIVMVALALVSLFIWLEWWILLTAVVAYSLGIWSLMIVRTVLYNANKMIDNV